MKRFSFLAILVLLFLPACRQNRTPCDIKSLMLEENSFPGKVSAEPLDIPISDAPPESAEQIIYIGTGLSTDVVQQDVMKFPSVYMASKFFKSRESQTFVADTDRGQWETPEKLAAIKLTANQYHLACGVVLSEKTCRWLARYKTYYLYLRSDISDNGMTEEVFLNAVEEINTRMDKCLSK